MAAELHELSDVNTEMQDCSRVAGRHSDDVIAGSELRGPILGPQGNRERSYVEKSC